MTHSWQKEKQLFLTVPKPVGDQCVLYDSMVEFLRKMKGQEVSLVPMNVQEHRKRAFRDPDFYLSLLYFFVHVVLCILSKRKQLPMYRYEGVDIGKYAAATALRDPNACINKMSYIKRFFLAAWQGMIYFSYAKWVSTCISYAYLHDTGYLYGIVVDTLLKKNVKVFLKGYPHNLVLCSGRYCNQVNVKVCRDEREGFSEQEAEEYMVRRLEKPAETISYIRVNEEKQNDIKLPVGKCVVIYTHSFTDVQLGYGYDGFASVYEWLVFTIDSLKDHDLEIIVKGHPNFWAPLHESHIVQWDKKIWQHVVDKYSNTKNITLIDWPINNYTLLSKLDKEKTLLISHHGNAIVEGAFLGFMTLSSVCSLWGERYKFGMVWKTRQEYIELLTKEKWNFQVDKMEVLHFVHDKYLNPYGYHSDNFWLSLIARSMNIQSKDLSQKPSLFNAGRIRDYKSLIDKISDSIIEISG